MLEFVLLLERIWGAHRWLAMELTVGSLLAKAPQVEGAEVGTLRREPAGVASRNRSATVTRLE